MLKVLSQFNISEIAKPQIKRTIYTIKNNSLVNKTLFSSQFTKPNLRKICERKNHANDTYHSDNEDLIDGELDSKMHKHSVRYIFKSCQEDDLMSKLNSIASVQDVFDVIQSKDSEIKPCHISKAVLVLWDIQKNFYEANNTNIVPPKHHDKTNYIARNYISQLINQKGFQSLLQLMDTHCIFYNQETLSCMALYLIYIGVDINHSVIQKMLNIFISTADNNTTLTSLSRIFVVLANDNSLNSVFLSQQIIPLIEKKLDSCQNTFELKLLTICLTNCSKLISSKLLDKYQIILEDYLINNKINEDHNLILKIIQFLNQPCWKNYNLKLLNQCILHLQSTLGKLAPHEAIVVSKTLFRHHEPASILNQLQQEILKMYHQSENSMISLEVQLKLLASLISFSNMVHKLDINKILKDFIPKCDSENSFNEIYKILKLIRMKDRNINDQFWNTFIQFMEENNAFKDPNNILLACSNFLKFAFVTNYRNHMVEKSLLKHLLVHVEGGIVSLIPATFSEAAAFILSYSKDSCLLKNIIYKIEEISEQLDPSNYFFISKGLQVALDVTKNKYLSNKDVNLLNTMLNRYCVSKAPQVRDIVSSIYMIKGSIYRSYNNWEVEEEMLKKVFEQEEIPTSYIKSIVFCLKSRSFLIPAIMEKIAVEMKEKKQDMMGFDISNFLYLLYILDYCPREMDLFFSTVTDVIIRDQERLTGLSYLQALLGLCYFNKLPNFLIKQAFNVRFMEKLDIEVIRCNSKDSYPLRVRQTLLQLNRAVCLEYPECKVPWFHKKIVDDIIKRNAVTNSHLQFKLNINDYILEIIKNPKALQENFVTPYGYIVDFVIYLDANNNFIEENESCKKLAVLLRKPYNFTRIKVHLKGRERLKIRHLEILGYEVVGINFDEWKKLLTKDEKINYLSALIIPHFKNTCKYTS